MKKMMVLSIFVLAAANAAFASGAWASDDRVVYDGESEVIFTYNGPEGVSARVYQDGALLGGIDAGTSKRRIVADGSHVFEVRPGVYDSAKEETIEDAGASRKLTVSSQKNRSSARIVIERSGSGNAVREFSLANTVAIQTQPNPDAETASAPTAPVPASAQISGNSYYVSAAGNDENDGLSEATAFKTLSHAVRVADNFDTIKTITVIGTLNQASEEGSSDEYVFRVYSLLGNEEKPILITGIPGAPAGRRAVLSARGTEKDCVDVFHFIGNSVFRFEHIEISGSMGIGLVVSLESAATLGTGAVVRNNGSSGVAVSRPKDEYRDSYKSGSLILEGGEIRDNADSGVLVNGSLTLRSGTIANNKSKDAGGGVFVNESGVFTMSGGSITGNSTTTSDTYGGGGVVVLGRFTMSGGSISGNTAAGEGGGVYVASGGVFNQTGGSVSGNRVTLGSIPNVYADRGGTANLPRSSTSAPSTASAPRPASPPRQEGSLSSGTISATNSPSSAPAQTRRSQPSVDFGFTAHLNLYTQGWHENVVSLGIPLQLGFELELPFITLDVLGEASAGMGYGNFFEYHLGGMGELYFFDQSFGLGAGMGFYGNDFNLGDVFDSGSSSGAKGSVIAYARPVKAKYYRFALIFRGGSKTTLYGELYEDGNWGFGLMWGGVLTE